MSDAAPFFPDRASGLSRLSEFLPRAGSEYTRNRNFDFGPQNRANISMLSPWLRHRLITEEEVVGQVLSRHSLAAAEKFVQEVCWRTYWKGWLEMRPRVWRDYRQDVLRAREELDSAALDRYVAAISGKTGIDCFDAWWLELTATGYLHNHARMWLAAYVVHWRRIHWQAGAAWFLEHLLDGDPASNHLSWQWVASTFSHKPYYFNRENLERFTRGRYCSSCPLYGQCDFEGSYETLQDALFRPVEPIESPDNPAWANPNAAPEPPALPQAWPEAERVLVWIHGDRLSPVQPAFEKYPDAPAVFVWDDDLLDQWGITLKRLVFMTECLAEMPVEIDRGDVAARLAAAAEAHGRDIIVTAPSPSPRFETITTALSQNGIRIVVMPEEPLVPDAAYDLRRFSRYWRKAQKRAFDYP